MNSVLFSLARSMWLVNLLRCHRQRVRKSVYFGYRLISRTVSDFVSLVHKRFPDDSSPFFLRMMTLLNGYIDGVITIAILEQEFSVLFQTQPDLYQDFLSLFHVDRTLPSSVYSQKPSVPVSQLDSQPLPQFTYTQVPAFLSIPSYTQPSLLVPPVTPQIPFPQYTQVPPTSPPAAPVISPSKSSKSSTRDSGPMDPLRQHDARRFAKFVKLCHLFTKVSLRYSTHR